MSKPFHEDGTPNFAYSCPVHYEPVRNASGVMVAMKDVRVVQSYRTQEEISARLRDTQTLLRGALAWCFGCKHESKSWSGRCAYRGVMKKRKEIEARLKEVRAELDLYKGHRPDLTDALKARLEELEWVLGL